MLPYNDDKEPDDLDETNVNGLTTGEWLTVALCLFMIGVVLVLTYKDLARVFGSMVVSQP